MTSSMPAIYRTRIHHIRTTPVRHEFSYRSYSWYADIDRLPRLPRLLADFRAADHFAAPGDSLRARLDTVLERHEIDSCPRVMVLMNARVLGHVFNPLSLFWCYGPDNRVKCVVAEVHNTYGQRHSYVAVPDHRGHARLAKQLYVSPFNDASGSYELSVPEPADQLAIRITLHRNGHGPFVATMRGERQQATRRAILATQLRYPVAPLLVSARIRKQGIALWRRGVQIVPRPQHPQEETR